MQDGMSFDDIGYGKPLSTGNIDISKTPMMPILPKTKWPTLCYTYKEVMMLRFHCLATMAEQTVKYSLPCRHGTTTEPILNQYYLSRAEPILNES